jgi:hypothetical protein
MSLTFAMIGLAMSGYVYVRLKNTQLAMGVFYFFLMEFLQYFQYLTIDQCENPTNRILTLVGFLHICFQPYFTHLLNASVTSRPSDLERWLVVMRLCLIGGFMIAGRYFLTQVTDWDRQHFDNDTLSTEWIRGEDLCTFSGKFHLAWSVPMADPTYYVPGTQLHSFLMFVPFFVVKFRNFILGVFLWATGPYLAAYVTDNLMEQASIWCFFSIAQIGVMVYVLRTMIVSGGKPIDMTTKPYVECCFIWPTRVVVPERNEKGENIISKKKK